MCQASRMSWGSRLVRIYSSASTPPLALSLALCLAIVTPFSSLSRRRIDGTHHHQHRPPARDHLGRAFRRAGHHGGCCPETLMASPSFERLVGTGTYQPTPEPELHAVR